MTRPLARRVRAALLVSMAIALGGCSRAPSPEPPGRTGLDGVIQAAWDFDDPEASEARFRELAGRATDPDRAELETQVARALGLRGRYTDALEVLDALDARVQPPSDRLGVRSRLERGRCLRSEGKPDAARPWFTDAWERARAARLDGLAIDAAHMTALTLEGEPSIAWNRRALELASSSTDPAVRRWQVSLHNNMGWTYHDEDDHVRALDSFQRSLDAARSARDSEATHIAQWSVGRELRSLGRHAEALDIQRALARDAGAADGFVYEEIAENLLATSHPCDAVPYFARAFALLSQDRDLSTSEPARLERLHVLGEGSCEGVP